MLDRFYSDPRVLQRLRGGPLGPYLDSVATVLFEQGFARQTTGQRQLHLLGDLSQWLEQLGLRVEDLEERTIVDFLNQPAQQRVWVRHTRAVLGLLLRHLRVLVGPGRLHAPPGLSFLFLGQLVQHVALLVNATALH